jgi:hypothetical protein
MRLRSADASFLYEINIYNVKRKSLKQFFAFCFTSQKYWTKVYCVNMLNDILVKALGFNYTKRVGAAMFTGAKHTIILLF